MRQSAGFGKPNQPPVTFWASADPNAKIYHKVFNKLMAEQRDPQLQEFRHIAEQLFSRKGTNIDWQKMVSGNEEPASAEPDRAQTASAAPAPPLATQGHGQGDTVSGATSATAEPSAPSASTSASQPRWYIKPQPVSPPVLPNITSNSQPRHAVNNSASAAPDLQPPTAAAASAGPAFRVETQLSSSEEQRTRSPSPTVSAAKKRHFAEASSASNHQPQWCPPGSTGRLQSETAASANPSSKVAKTVAQGQSKTVEQECLDLAMQPESSTVGPAEEIATLRARVAELSTQLAERDAELVEVKTQLREKSLEIRELNVEVRELKLSLRERQ